jgi:putative aldouronate transport system substrate-binding protein
MKPKEIAVMLALLALIMGVIALIPSKPRTAEGPAGNSSPVDWNAVADDPRRTLAISWMGIAAYPEAVDGSWIQRRLEERFNVTLKPLFMDWNAFGQRRPLMLCAGQVPDVIWDGDPIGVRNNLRNGFIMEVPYEVILRYAPTYVRLLNRYGKEAWLYTQYQGKNYGLPTFFEAANRPRISCWRMDWLRKVGIEKVPETLDDMHEALRRLRFDDPDGNGKRDTFGWSPSIGHWSLAFVEVFAAHDVLAFDFMRRDGKVVWGGILPETRQALGVLRQWYAEGLLDPDFVLDSRQNSGEGKFLNGRIGYLHAVDDFAGNYDLTAPASLYSKLRSFCPTAEITPGPPLRDKNGDRRGRTWGGAGHILQFGRHLEREPQKVLRILGMIEAMTCDEQLYLDAQWGRRGLHWDYTPEKGRTLLPAFEDKRVRAEQMLDGCVFFYPSSLDITYLAKYQRQAVVEFNAANRQPAWGMMNVLGKSDVVPSAGRYMEDLRNYQMTFFVEIITGKRGLAEFDAFVKEWRRRGGDVLTDEANAMYGAMHTIWRRVGVGSEAVR